jgi:hypothetical protein
VWKETETETLHCERNDETLRRDLSKFVLNYRVDLASRESVISRIFSIAEYANVARVCRRRTPRYAVRTSSFDSPEE